MILHKKPSSPSYSATPVCFKRGAQELFSCRDSAQRERMYACMGYDAIRSVAVWRRGLWCACVLVMRFEHRLNQRSGERGFLAVRCLLVVASVTGTRHRFICVCRVRVHVCVGWGVRGGGAVGVCMCV